MDSLRERVAAAAFNHNGRWEDTKFEAQRDGYKNEWRSVADAAIAAFEQTLLSDEVVEAAARAMADANDWLRALGKYTKWDDINEAVRGEYRTHARAALQAALAAAKGTKGSA